MASSSTTCSLLENLHVSQTASTTETFMNTGLPLLGDLPYKVHSLDADVVAFGRKEIELAEHEMPGLMALRDQ